MASYEQNLRNIRGEAIHGPEMRESIAEAIQQSQGYEELTLFDRRVQEAEERIIQSTIVLDMENIASDDFRMILV